MHDSSSQIFTEADFNRLSWHDNPIYSLAIDNDIGQWKSDLVLDIDYIVEWLCGVSGTAQFKIAAATLVFHHVTDLNVNVDWGDSGMQVAICAMVLDHIAREPLEKQRICLDRPYYRWNLRLNSPRPGGEIRFGASGFTQHLRQSPILCAEQQLSPEVRAKLR